MTAVAEVRSSVDRSKTKFRPDIQGLRAIAVLLVVIYHSGTGWLSGGYVGVDVFFVISGFLITTHLLESLERHGKIHFANFYAKRARRILPAALLVAALTVLAAWAWMPPLLLKEVMQGAVAVALYVPNMLFAWEGTDYLAEAAPSVFQHYWSLGIEEQFYLVWPVILALGFWVFRRKEHGLLVLTASLTIVSFILCVLGIYFLPQSWVFFTMPTRAWELGVGGLIAFLLRSEKRWLNSSSAGFLSWVGLILLLTVALLFDAATPFPGYFAALPVAASALMIIGGAAPGNRNANTLLSKPWMQFVGAISYSLYLVHWPLQVIPQAAVGLDRPLPLGIRLLLCLAAIPLAWLLYRFVEDPVRKWKPLITRSPKWSGLAALAASLTVIPTAGGIYLGSAQAALATERTVSESEVARTDFSNTGYVPSNLKPTLREASDDTPRIYSTGCIRYKGELNPSGCQEGTDPDAPLVFLFGDSHAANWYPALAELAERGLIRLDTNVKSACVSIDLEQWDSGTEFSDCHEWRRGVAERIEAERPDVVILGNYANVDKPLMGGNDDFVTRWTRGLESTIEAIEGPAVIVMADVPDHHHTPALCLSANLEDTQRCAVPKSKAFVPGLKSAEKRTVSPTDARYVDFTDYLCTDSICPPIIDDSLAYRDGHHLTASFSQRAAQPLWEELQKALKER